MKPLNRSAASRGLMELVLVLYIIGLLLALLAAYFFFGSFLLGAGYQPTPRKVADRMMEMAEVGPDDHVVDLGAGTGSLLFLAAERHGAEVTGVEAEPLRYLYLRLRRFLSPARSRIVLSRGNLYHHDVSDATVVLVFLWPGAMARLRWKLEHELAPGTRVVSYWHPVPGWIADREDASLRTYLYVRK